MRPSVLRAAAVNRVVLVAADLRVAAVLDPADLRAARAEHPAVMVARALEALRAQRLTKRRSMNSVIS